MIKEADIERAVDYLRNSAQEAAEARAQVKYLAEFLKAKVAKIATAQAGMSAAAAEQIAKAHPDYSDLLDGYRVAVEKDAFHTFKREAAAAMIDAWRTQCSNARVEGRIG